MNKVTKKKSTKKASTRQKSSDLKSASNGKGTYVLNDLPPSRCPFCKSTNREEYHRTTIQDGPVRIAGVVYAKVERRRTRCSDCGRPRIDRILHPMPEVPGGGQDNAQNGDR